MKRPILVSSILVLFLVTCSSLPSHAQDARGIEESCRDFVQSFYDWYVKPSSWPLLLKDKRSALRPELYRALKEDDEAQAKSPGEIVGLDWDPILSGNDRPPGEHYVVDQIILKGDGTCWAELHQVWSGGKGEEVVAAELVNNTGQWQFVNFYYSFPHSNLSESVSKGGLLTILKRLREAREKQAKAPSAEQSSPKPQDSMPAVKKPPSTPTPRN